MQCLTLKMQQIHYPIVKIQDTISLFYAAVNANLAGEKAKQKQYYIELLNENAKSMTIYKSLADLYISEKDSSECLKSDQGGKENSPEQFADDIIRIERLYSI